MKVQTVLFENFPVFRAHFNADGSEILVGSLYPSLLSYNMNTGRTTKFQLKGSDYQDIFVIFEAIIYFCRIIKPQ